jgi:hypothetical protein
MPPKTHKESAEEHLRLALKEIKMVKGSETPKKKRSETPEKKRSETPEKKRPHKKK